MSIKFSSAVRDAMMNSIETTIGTSPQLRFYSGSAPSDITLPATGALIVNMTLPADWMTVSSLGQVGLNGLWTGTATAVGTAGYFRIYNQAGTTAHMQGTVTANLGGGDLQIDQIAFVIGDDITINSFTMTAPHA